MEIKITELERNARAATPGPYFVDEDPRPGMKWNRSIDTDHERGHTVCFMTHSDGKDPERDKATADHIAGNYPAVTLAFCKLARAAIAWGNAETDDAHATLLAELNLNEALAPFVDGEGNHEL